MLWQNKYLQSTGMFAQCEAEAAEAVKVRSRRNHAKAGGAESESAKLPKVKLHVVAFAHVCEAVALALAENRLPNTAKLPEAR